MTGVLGIPASGGVSVFVPYFDPAQVLDAIERYRVNVTLMVPVMVEMLLAAPEFGPERIATLETLVYGASPMPQGLLDRLLDTFPHLDLYQGYGMTEASAALTLLTAKDHRLGGTRCAPPAGRCTASRSASAATPTRSSRWVGRVKCARRAGNFMREYWNRPEETDEAFRDGWYHSGDSGYVDERGFLFIVDRLKDMIVTGGENVYSIEVENAISTHPAVAQVAVIGIPHELWGEAVHAVVVLHPGMDATAEDLIEHARKTIAGYKLPKSVEFRTEPLPLSGALKPLKRELRKPYWEGRASARSDRRRHPWLIAAVVVVALIAVAVGGAVIWWNQRGPTTPSIGGAVDRFRSSKTTPNESVAMRPDPGVYIYAGTGDEHLSFLATRQSQAGSLPGTVTWGAGGCWTFAIDYNSFHRQTWDRCSKNGRLVEPSNTTDQKFDFGALSQSEHTVVTCDPPVVLFDPAAAPGTRVATRCTGHSQTTKADMDQRGTITFVGRTSIVVEGTRVPAFHYTQVIRITGDQTGKQHEELWLAANGLPLQEQRTISVDSPAPAPLNKVTYTEQGSWRITSLTPRT